MSFTSLLIDTCTTRRFTEGANDAYGVPVKTWADNLTSQACRIEALVGKISGRELTIGAELVVADYVLFMQDVDVTEQDRILLGAITYEVLLVNDRKDGGGV